DLGRDEEEYQEAWLRFVMRWQQFTGPVMAKGLEDTALYVYNRLVSLKEVGSDPYRADTPVDMETFHDGNLARLERWPSTLNTTSTHDTKRSEDVRARINVLSEVPGAWTRRLARWSRWNEPNKGEVNGHRVPEPNMEVLLYQTLIGAWPLQADEVPEFRDRLNEYLIKAAREAKVHTSWVRPNEAYESALLGFVDALLEESHANEFLDDFLRFQQRVAFYGAFNALGQVLLKIASPGVPDFYQGTELWNFSLVDPDNRRPVDFPKRIRLLAEVKRQEDEGLLPLVRDLLARWEDGRIKLYVTSKALTFRRAHRELLGEGAYLPLRAHGSKDEHLCAFARCNEEAWALVCVPRWLTGLGSPGRPPVGRRVWGETALRLPPDAPEAWHNVLTGEPVAASVDEAGGKTVALHHVFEHLPIALLSGGTQGT
ncbi:MAG: malto-oligosyltrehalose synthase, partial [Candidatus Tectimicrobiota bacterium]